MHANIPGTMCRAVVPAILLHGAGPGMPPAEAHRSLAPLSSGQGGE